MGRADQLVPRCVNQLLLSLRLRPPEDEHDKVGLLVDDSGQFVGEPLPIFTARPTDAHSSMMFGTRPLACLELPISPRVAPVRAVTGLRAALPNELEPDLIAKA
jgi:hypothetical protein